MSSLDRSPLPPLTLLARVCWAIVGWLLNGIYVGLLAVVAPVLIYRSLKLGKYRSGWSQKLWGSVPKLAPANSDAPRYWLHAVSVGEVLLLQSVIAELKRRQPSAEVVISTTTATGHNVAQQKFPDCRHCYFPLDFTWAVRRAIARIQPTRIVLVELELWPNFIVAARRANVPLSLINGRLSERSFRGYARLNLFGGPTGWLSFIGRVLRCFDSIAVQTPTYAERFIALGATAERVRITGSVKYDRVETNRSNVRTLALRTAFGLHSAEIVFVAGSTQETEELAALRAWREARKEFPQLRLVLVPRHQERFEDVARLVVAEGHSLIRRSRQEAAQTSVRDAVILLDTLGELSDCWGLADFAFVGGSLTNRGGQNMIEPAGYGAAVCFGPNTRNFRDIVENLLEREAAVVVEDEQALTATILNWLRHPSEAEQLGKRAQDFVATQRGATTRTVELLVGEENVVRTLRAA